MIKVSELSRIVKQVQRFEAIELADGAFALTVIWFDGQDVLHDELFTARGEQKRFKTATSIFNFLRSIYNSVRLTISFMS